MKNSNQKNPNINTMFSIQCIMYEKNLEIYTMARLLIRKGNIKVEKYDIGGG
jgi:hypothetical protein